MGIFDALSGALGDALRRSNISGQTPQPGPGSGGFPDALSGILAGTGFGNLTVLAERLSAGGLHEQVSSWLGSGANLPVSGDQIREALGDEHVQKIAQQLGIPADRIMQAMAQYLPSAVDKASPNGTIQTPERSSR
jgi:uncharacterized protein YidB (DUF937 family)